jgi:MFS family permease
VPTAVADLTRLTRWRAALLAAYVIAGMTSASWGPRLPDLTRELHVTTGGMGAVLAATSVGLLLGLVSSSPIARLLGIRRAIGAGFAVTAACMALTALGVGLGSPLLAAGALLLLGFGAGVIDVLVNVDGASIEQRSGRTFLPRLHAAWVIGAAVGAAIGAGCAALGLGAAPQFAGEAVAIAVIGAGIVAGLPAGARHSEAEAEAESPVLAQRFRAWLRGWSDPRLLLLGLLILGVELAEGSARTWLPLAAHRDDGQPASIAALFVTVFSLVTAALRIVAGPVVDRIGRIAVVRVTIVVGVAGLVLVILAGDVWWLLAGTVLWGAGVCLAGPLAMSAAAEGGAGAAARVSVVSTIGFFAGLAGPPLIGFLAQQVGLLPSFWLLVVLMVAALLTTPALRRRGQLSSRPERRARAARFGR